MSDTDAPDYNDYKYEMKHKAEATSIAERICKERDYTSMSASELQTFFDNCKSKFDETETDSMEEAFYEKVCDTIASHAGIYFDGSK